MDYYNYIMNMEVCFCSRSIWFRLGVVAMALYFLYRLVVFVRYLYCRFRPRSPSSIKRKKKAAAKKNKQSNLSTSGASMAYNPRSFLEDIKVFLFSPPRCFTFQSLIDATQNFQLERRMSSSDFGVFYKGENYDRYEVFAILQLSQCTRQNRKDFVHDVWLLNRANHPNLAKLIGYCDEEMKRCLVYEYEPGGSLETYLLGNQKCLNYLDWNMRMRIALGVARAIEYLQNFMKPSIHHYYINPSNIWLDKNFTPKLSAFGVIRMFPRWCTVHPYCYAWNDYMLNENITIQADIYGFGFLLLMLITGKKDSFREDDGVLKILSDWVQPYLEDQQNLSKMVDPMLEGKFDIGEVYKCGNIAKRCMAKQPDSRPLIADLVREMNQLVK